MSSSSDAHRFADPSDSPAAPSGKAWPTTTSRPRARTDLSYVELDDNVAVYDEVGRVLILLNVSACAILQACDGRRTFEAVVSGLAEEYVADRDAIREDAWRTLRKLASMGLVAEAT